MTFAPTQAYHGRRLETLAAPGSGELPDCRLPEATRRRCKRLARQAAEVLNTDGLMFLAAAVEVEAKRKRKSARREPDWRTPA